MFSVRQLLEPFANVHALLRPSPHAAARGNGCWAAHSKSHCSPSLLILTHSLPSVSVHFHSLAHCPESPPHLSRLRTYSRSLLHALNLTLSPTYTKVKYCAPTPLTPLASRVRLRPLLLLVFQLLLCHGWCASRVGGVVVACFQRGAAAQPQTLP
jgi:hypothetical protein